MKRLLVQVFHVLYNKVSQNCRTYVALQYNFNRHKLSLKTIYGVLMTMESFGHQAYYMNLLISQSLKKASLQSFPFLCKIYTKRWILDAFLKFNKQNHRHNNFYRIPYHLLLIHQLIPNYPNSTVILLLKRPTENDSYFNQKHNLRNFY